MHLYKTCKRDILTISHDAGRLDIAARAAFLIYLCFVTLLCDLPTYLSPAYLPTYLPTYQPTYLFITYLHTYTYLPVCYHLPTHLPYGNISAAVNTVVIMRICLSRSGYNCQALVCQD